MARARKSSSGTARRRRSTPRNGMKRLERDVRGVFRAVTRPVRKVLRG